MASLPFQLVRSLIDACLQARIDRETLLAAVPPEVVAGIPTGDTPQRQLLQIWCHLNKMPWSSGGPHPMDTALETGAWLASIHGLSDVFRVAQIHFAEPATLDNSKDRAFHAIFTRRMKESYLDFGCRVTPALEDSSEPFLVEHPDRRTSVVAVFHDGGDAGPQLGTVIATVTQWLGSMRSSGEDAEGYIVLAPSARKADRDQVIQAQLYPIDYRERRSVGFDKIETVVRCLLGVEPSSEEAGFSILQGGAPRPAGDALASFLRDYRTRAWLLLQPRDVAADVFQRELFHVAARSFLQHGPPAPLPLGMEWGARRMSECASDLFTRNGVPVSSIVLERVLREGVLCPILLHDAPVPHPSSPHASAIPRLVEGLSERSKLLVVFSPEDGAAARQVEKELRSAGCEARVVRALVNEG